MGVPAGVPLPFGFRALDGTGVFWPADKHDLAADTAQHEHAGILLMIILHSTMV